MGFKLDHHRVYHLCHIETTCDHKSFCQLVLSSSSCFLDDLTCIARQWVYDEDVSEYYVITDDQTLLKKAERTTEREETQLPDAWLV